VNLETNVRHIVILAPPGAQSLDISGPLDVFREAAKLKEAGPTYAVRLVSTQPDRVIHACACSPIGRSGTRTTNRSTR
jgi:putative intracellular protease/amidase